MVVVLVVVVAVLEAEDCLRYSSSRFKVGGFQHRSRDW